MLVGNYIFVINHGKIRIEIDIITRHIALKVTDFLLFLKSIHEEKVVAFSFI